MTNDREPIRLRRPLAAHNGGYYLDAAWIVGPSNTRWFTAVTDEQAAALLLARARRIVRAIPDGACSVELTSPNGILAWILGRMLDLRPSVTRPALIIDVTGSGRLLADAIDRLDDGGTLLATDHDPTSPMTVDPYPDLHSRGLHLIGVSATLTAPDLDSAAESPELSFVLDRLRTVREGDPPDHDGLWFRVQPDDGPASEP